MGSFLVGYGWEALTYTEIRGREGRCQAGGHREYEALLHDGYLAAWNGCL